MPLSINDPEADRLARAVRLRVGFYYSLMDWHHPDGLKAKDDPEGAASFCRLHPRPDPRVDDELRKDRCLVVRRRGSVGCGGLGIREDESNGPEASAGHCHQQSELAGWRFFYAGTDHSGHERRLGSCMTLNDSWGYTAADDNWKSPQRIVRTLSSAARTVVTIC